MKNKVLATLVDKNHLEYAKALFASAHFNGGWDGDYLLLAHDIDPPSLSWFEEKGIKIKHCQPLKDYHKDVPGWKHIFLSKLYLFEEDMKRWNKVIYIDVDCLIRSSINRLTAVKTIAGVPFYHDRYYRFYKREKIKSQNLFYTGVFSIDTSTIQSDTFIKMLEIAKDLHQEFPQGVEQMSHEEVVISKYFNYQFEKLPITFNTVPLIFHRALGVPVSSLQGIIIHFASYYLEDKPWNQSNYFYPDWKSNHDRADEIDVYNPVKGVKKWTTLEMWRYQIWLKSLFWVRRVGFKVDRLIGNIGLFIKSVNPRFYFFLKSHLKKF